MESYRTIAAQSTGHIEEKKSEFIAVAAPVTSEEEAMAKLEEVRTNHRTARHNVYAYLLREGARQRYSDDGEPAKTAGLPVLSTLLHADITNCIIVVTRYFGGTLLGTGGLVRAYTGAANAALQNAELLTVRLCVTLTIHLTYPLYDGVCRLLELAGARLEEPLFTDQIKMKATVPYGQEEEIIPKIQEMCRGEAVISLNDPFYIPF